MKLNPFFYYFGGKWRSAVNYPIPIHQRLVEPFAGAAGYSVRHYDQSVELYDASEQIIGVWQYLIGTSADEIRKLPLDVAHVDDLDVCQEAKWLIGFWINQAAAQPHLTPSAWMRSGRYPNSSWGAAVRERLATQVSYIRHWTASVCEYQDVPLGNATWFVDPPYDHASGRRYPKKVADYAALGAWCQSLGGQVIVCEREGADWLPFKPTDWNTLAKPLPGATRVYSPEVMWTNSP